MNKRPLLIVGCGFPQLGLLQAARALGVPLVGLDANPEAIGVPLLDRFLRVSTADADAIAAAAREVSAAGLTTTGSELALTSTTRAARLAGMPFYADPETIFRCQNKGAMRAAYERAGLPVPRFALCQGLDQARSFAAGLPRVVVKPAHGWGQRGVSRVEGGEGLDEAFAVASRENKTDGQVVVEEWIDGHEISVNGWVEGGELAVYAVTDREVFPGVFPLGVMRSEIAPSALDDRRLALGVEAARRAARALGLTRGPCYTQVCVGAERAVVFETAARCGGGFDADVTRLVSGVDLYRRLLGVALGDASLEAEGATSRRHPAALVRFLRPGEGVVSEVSGLDEALASEGVVDGAVYARPGQRLAGLVNAASRVAHLLVTGPGRAEAVARADAAERKLRIAVDAAPLTSGT